MEIDQINKLFKKLQLCESQFETYQNGKKIILPFKDLYSLVLQVLAFFEQKQIQGGKVGIIGTNTLEWVVIDLACIAAGIITVPFDPAISHVTGELLQEFELSLILSNIKAYKNNEKVYWFEEVCKNQFVEATMTFHPVQYSNHDLLTYKFTSGSTQGPKVIGAMKQSVDAAITFIQQIFKHTRQDKILVFLPLHTYQQRYWTYSAILFDFDLILLAKEYVFYSIEIDKPTVIMGVPFLYETIMKNFLAEMDSEKHLSDDELKKAFKQQLGGRIGYLWTGSAPIGADTLAFYEKMEVPIYQGYGMNEVCIVSKNYPGNNKIGSVGKLLPGKHVKFDDNNQLLVKSDYAVNNSYYKASEEDNKATFLEDGYIATGDLGYIDEEGYLFINGRIKELIVLANAIKIHPAPVEKKIETSPIIKYCLVYGDDRPYLVALVVPADLTVGYGDIKSEIARMNELLKPQERICNFFIVTEDFASNKNRLSGQNKILRNNIIKDYSEALEKLYIN